VTHSEDKQLTQTGIAASVVVHAVLFFIMAWLLGLDQAARAIWRQARVANEVPQVTLLFPEQVMPMPALKPKDTSKKEFVSTSANEAEEKKPSKAEFESDRNTKAASKAAPFPDAIAQLPSMRGNDQPNLELTNRKYQDGKLAANDGGKPKPVIAPHTPQEPAALPEQVAKAEPTPMAKLMQEVEKSDARLSVEVRKPNEPASPQVAAPVEPAALPEAAPKKRLMEDFTPFTESTKTKGAIGSQGEDAVDAENTPMGKYKANIHAAVGKKWYAYRNAHKDAAGFGTLMVMFYVTHQGKVEGVEFLKKSGNPLMDEFTLKAIRDTELPAMPRNVAESLDNDRMRVEYTFTIH
jgi:TonB family protein